MRQPLGETDSTQICSWKGGEPQTSRTERFHNGQKKTSLEKSQERFKNPAIPTFALVYTIIGSESLTTVFGMGTGDPFRYGHREGVTKALACRDPCWIGKCQIILQPQL